jgi:hypothetical protein
VSPEISLPDDVEVVARAPAIPPAQSVHRCTPQPVLDLVYEVLGAPVGIDPCSNPRSIVKAQRTVAPPEDGLLVPWHEYKTGYVNPPFGKTEEPRWIKRPSPRRSRAGEDLAVALEDGGALVRPAVRASPCMCLWGSPSSTSRPDRFTEDAGATFNTYLAYLGPRYEDFARVFSRAGRIIYPQHDRALTARITGAKRHGTRPAHPRTCSRARDGANGRSARPAITASPSASKPPHETTVREILDRDDMPDLEHHPDLTVHELASALALVQRPVVTPPVTTRGKKSSTKSPEPVDKRQPGCRLLGRAGLQKRRRARTLRPRIEHHRQFPDSDPPRRDHGPKPVHRARVQGCDLTLDHRRPDEKVGDGQHARYRARQPPRKEHDDPKPPTVLHPAATPSE